MKNLVKRPDIVQDTFQEPGHKKVYQEERFECEGFDDHKMEKPHTTNSHPTDNSPPPTEPLERPKKNGPLTESPVFFCKKAIVAAQAKRLVTE